ncbi:tail fiber protein [Vibrio phage K567]
MAELRSTTAIGGNIVWHGGNLRFDPQGETVLYDGYKVFTELDKPDPHTDLTESVVKRSGDTMSGTLNIPVINGCALDLTHPDLGGYDNWIAMGNGTASTSYSWEIRYVGTSSGLTGNELRIVSTYGSNPKYWQFGHDGEFQYYDGSAHRMMLHTGNINSTLDGRYANVTGDTFTGAVTFGGGDVTLYDTDTSYSHELRFRNSAKQAGIDFSTAGLLRFIDRDVNDVRVQFDLTDGSAQFDGNVESSQYLSGVRLYAGTSKANGYFFSDVAGRTAFKDGDFYIQSTVDTTYIYSPIVYLGSTTGTEVHLRGNSLEGNKWEFLANGGLDMKGSNITFDSGYGFEGESSSYALKFNSTNIWMESVGDITIEADSNDNETTRYLNLKAGLNTLRVAGGAANVNSLEFNGHDVVHMGNYTSKLDGRYVNASGDTMTGNLTMGSAWVVGTSTGYFLDLMGGNAGPTLQSNASVIIQADGDGTGPTEGIELRAGAGSRNTLRIDSTSSASNTDAMTYNDSIVQHDGRSEMKFDDGTASIEYNSSTNSIDFIFA